ncbi:hypothetical protein [Piscinibacter sp.]|uniref:hypothetical protein n=1 Tax=Piscinibacter sp. TaxID=1903157 RepID=UPI002F40BF5B
MSYPSPSRIRRLQALEAQKADFTSEGSPPPGKVALVEPVMPAGVSKALVKKAQARKTPR